MNIKKIALASLIASSLLAAASSFAGERFAEFPVAVKMSAAAKVGSTVYAGLGTAVSAWYALDTSKPGAQWKALTAFPDQQRDNANAVAIGTNVYVFAGQGKVNPADKNLIVFDTVWKYDTVANTWSKVLTRSPMGGLAAGVTTLDGQNILFFGGVNKAIFDGFFSDAFVTATDTKVQDSSITTVVNKGLQDEVTARYFDQRPEDYLFTEQVLSYNPAKNQWRNLGIDPNPVTIGTGVAVSGNKVTLIGGEIKPGLRSPNAKSVTVTGEKLSWAKLSPIVAAPGEAAQEGIAGSYAGYSNGVLLAAGGANFPGAWKQYNAGQLFAHKGLTKTWRSDIYAEVKGKWVVAGKLPAPLGYGSYVQLDDGVLVIGGELQGGAGSKDVFLMKWNGKSVDIVR
ncbi:N-acetylneuraminate epimerase [Collimonas antrihumi]|uniref:N-acetylneuraminate epimerase n=1 Tax=Collimonas antrihumi TaxID=1940615 RepID=UPI001B8C9F87|nr:N-acetylneuraminate epimerase [Collimonas antrihumi]